MSRSPAPRPAPTALFVSSFAPIGRTLRSRAVKLRQRSAAFGCLSLALMTGKVVFCVLRLVVACERKPQPSGADLRLATQQPRMLATREQPQSATMLPSGCLTPGKIRLRGALRSELHLGPPGYGESPAIDERDTVIALILPMPITLCRDSVSVNGDRRRSRIDESLSGTFHSQLSRPSGRQLPRLAL